MNRADKCPNILMILSDDHGYGDTSVYGGPNVQTPNIDRIASEGIRFTQFYANSPVCSPSRAALMTGRYPDLVGVPGVIRTHKDGNWGYFDTNAITLPQILKQGGYHSTHIGKWHLGLEAENHPCNRGFDTFRGFLGDMMEDYYTHLRDDTNFMRHDMETIDPEGHATDLFTAWAIETIRERSHEQNPFFLYLAYNAPHTPIQPPEEWVDRVYRREGDIDEKRARYVALVEHMDDGIGQVMNALHEAGIASNTLVVYASDNGGQTDAGACNDPFRGAKQEMYEGGIRVPCCVRWTDHISAGQVSDQIAMLMDFFPTFCDLAKVKVEHNIEARSLLPLLLGQRVDFSDRSYYWVRREGGEWRGHKYWGHAYHAVRRGEMKLMHNDAFSALELYNVSRDPLESQDLADTDEPGKHELCAFLQRQVHQSGAVPWRKSEACRYGQDPDL